MISHDLCCSLGRVANAIGWGACVSGGAVIVEGRAVLAIIGGQHVVWAQAPRGELGPPDPLPVHVDPRDVEHIAIMLEMDRVPGHPTIEEDLFVLLRATNPRAVEHAFDMAWGAVLRDGGVERREDDDCMSG